MNAITQYFQGCFVKELFDSKEEMKELIINLFENVVNIINFIFRKIYYLTLVIMLLILLY
jgi:hypothetical protein